MAQALDVLQGVSTPGGLSMIPMVSTFISRYFATVPPVQRWISFGIGAMVALAATLVAAAVTGWDPNLLIPISLPFMLLVGAGVVCIFRIANRQN